MATPLPGEPKTCSICHTTYLTELKRPDGDDRPVQEIFPREPRWKREQLISGICSDECWREFLGIPIPEVIFNARELHKVKS
jgi:hypothetical protein